MSTPTLTSLQDQVNGLLIRMAVLDGQGLVSPAVGYVQQTNAKLTGMRNDIDGSVLAIETIVNDLSALVQALQVSVNLLLTLNGLTVVSSENDFLTPPIT